MIPTALGNFVGGGLFVGAVYWYLYLTGEGNVAVDFNIGTLDTAMEAGGPMGRARPPKRRRDRSEAAAEDHNSDEVKDPMTLNGVDPDALPHSGSQLASAIGQELADGSVYAQSHADRTKTTSQSSDEKV